MTNATEVTSIKVTNNPELVVQIKMHDAHVCGNLDCRTISNAHDQCPSCTSHVTPVSALIEGEAKMLAFEMARDSAKVDICSYSVPEEDDGVKWYDTNAYGPHDQEQLFINRAVKFLDLSGDLIHHPVYASWVRWEEK